MGAWRYSSTILNFSIRCRRVTSFIPLPVPTGSVLGELKNCSKHDGEEKSLLLLLGIRTQFLNSIACRMMLQQLSYVDIIFN
jgi:hypothetical protein